MHVNKINGKVYIGQTKKSYRARWSNGKGYGHSSRFATAIKKYGWDGFEHIPLIEGLSKSEADYFERFFIEFFDSQNPEFGYNLTAGGDENPMDNLAIRENHHVVMKKLCADPEWQEKTREGMKKRSANPEWRENVRKGVKKRYADPEYQKKHREAMKKLCADPEWQEKTREGCQKLCKKVLCVETKIVYGSLKEAAIAVNLKKSNHISSCCSGKRKTTGGYHWEYV